MNSKGLQYQNIAHAGAQGSRTARLVPDPPGGTLHDYVPFYFAPRSPMLMAIDGGQVTGCDLRQADIVHIESTVDHVTMNNSQFVIYKRNATKPYAEAFTDLRLIETEIAWDLITEDPQLDGYCKYFFDKAAPAHYSDRMERRQAEFLVKNAVSIDSITKIGVVNAEKQRLVNSILAKYSVNLPVECVTDWYFLGQ